MHGDTSDWAGLLGVHEEPAPGQEDGAALPAAAVEEGPGAPERPAAAAFGEAVPLAGETAGAGGEPGGRVPFFEHPLYVEAMQALPAGKSAVVVSNLGELADLYPQESSIRDLLMRMELRSAVAQERELPTHHRSAAPALRNAVMLLLLATLGLVGIAGFYVAYEQLVSPVAETNQQAMEIRALEDEIARRMNARDWNGAIQKLEELESRQPGSQGIAEKLEYAERQKELGAWYTDARAAEEAGDQDGALLLLEQITLQEPGYQDVEARLQRLQTLQALERDWLAAESRVEARDWQGATTLLLDIRRRNPEFRREQVKERLFQIHELLARQSLDQAGGNPEGLRQALAYLNQALAERPTNQDLVRQRTLAQHFLAGSDARARGDWLEAVEQWEPVAEQQPGYQNDVLAAWLAEAYPKAARQAIAEAAGSVERLEQAAGYLDHAQQSSPDDQGLQQDRERVSAYLAGARAFEAGYWNQAIKHWGPLYAVQPGYQNGALERNLREACGASPDPDPSLCPP